MSSTENDKNKPKSDKKPISELIDSDWSKLSYYERSLIVSHARSQRPDISTDTSSYHSMSFVGAQTIASGSFSTMPATLAQSHSVMAPGSSVVMSVYKG